MPARALDKLTPIWHDAGIPFKPATLPPPFDQSPWPSHRTVCFTDDLVFDAAAAMQKLREPFERHLLEGQVTALRMDGYAIAEVTVMTAGGEQVFAPSLVCACAGAGNAGILSLMGLPVEVVAKSQLTRARHMVCARGPSLPNVSVYAQELTLVAHPMEDGNVMWLVTYDSPKPQFLAGEIDMTQAPAVSGDIVRGTLDRLKLLVPDFAERATQCEWQSTPAGKLMRRAMIRWPCCASRHRSRLTREASR